MAAKVKDSSPPTPPLTPPLLPVSCDGSQVQHEESHRSFSNYRILSNLGEGSFGKVIKCLKLDTSETVAVKFPKDDYVAKEEVSMLNQLRCLDPDKYNIVKFYDSFLTDGQTCLVFQILDISLFDYLKQRQSTPLQLNNIRSIIQQMATAFEALKSIGVIHTDVKLDNIMLVDHLKEPFRVKLIDFGCAILRSEAMPCCVNQPRFYRSPEILLGLPVSEAIDMWALGCLMPEMFLRCYLFPGKSEYDVMRFIIDILGQPADHLLAAGLDTWRFFKRKSFLIPGWTLKTPEEYKSRTGFASKETRRYTFRSLDELTELNLEKADRAEVDDRREFVDLLKQMLQMDASLRITPREVLAHPFITMSHLTNGSHHSSHSEAPPPAITSETVDEGPSQHPAFEPSSSQAQSRSNLSDGPTEQDSSCPQDSPQAVLDEVSGSQESLSEIPLSAITEGTPSLNTTEVGAPTASPAVDSAIVEGTLVPLSSPVASPAIAVNQAALNNNSRVNTNSAHSTPEVSNPKKKKKKGVRRFFSRLMRALCCCGATKVAPVE